jgi:hypothetical protein
LPIRFVLSQHATGARGRPTFQHTPSEPLDANRRNPCANGSNTPHNADRSRRVVPGRPPPAGSLRRTPGEVWRYNFELCFRAADSRTSSSQQCEYVAGNGALGPAIPRPPGGGTGRASFLGGCIGQRHRCSTRPPRPRGGRTTATAAGSSGCRPGGRGIAGPSAPFPATYSHCWRSDHWQGREHADAHQLATRDPSVRGSSLSAQRQYMMDQAALFHVAL